MEEMIGQGLFRGVIDLAPEYFREDELLSMNENMIYGGIAAIDAWRDAPEAEGVVDLHRLGGPITLDGVLDEAAWADIPPIPLTMYQPVYRGSSDRRLPSAFAVLSCG